MNSIRRANEKDFELIAGLGKKSYIESHGNSASKQDIEIYVKEKFNHKACKEELRDPKNIYHLISHDKRPAGYSKIIFDKSHRNIPLVNVTKLERLYLLKEFYDLKLGFELLKFNTALSKQHNQAGMWLYVWKENQRAVRFYSKSGFEIIGSYDFKITATHSNPNHQMFLRY